MDVDSFWVTVHLEVHLNDFPLLYDVQLKEFMKWSYDDIKIGNASIWILSFNRLSTGSKHLMDGDQLQINW